MSVLIDTSVWSLALRRRARMLNPVEQQIAQRWRDLTQNGEAMVIGMIRQELLSGVRRTDQFAKLQVELDAFDCLPTEIADHDLAAHCFNTCQAHGIAAGDVDMLICAAALRYRLPVFTLDNDFDHYAAMLRIRRYDPAKRHR